jgi:hypothetical protein
MFAEWFASKALSPVAIKLAGKFLVLAKEPAARKLEEMKVTLQFGFENYIRREIDKYSKIKTILGVNVPLNLQDIYINLYIHANLIRSGPARIATQSALIRDDDLIVETENKKRIVITGTAGAGKSMLMKYVFLQTLSKRDDTLPVFIELRELNDRPETSIVEYIHEKIKTGIEGFSLDQTKYALAKGIIILFLDGFDEIDFDRRLKRSKEIVQMGNLYELMTFYLSSRPDDVFRSWERFHVYNVVHLSRSQIELLVSKIPYDPELKTVFIRKLNSGLYESHKEFLVNPLLVIMMLITLEQFAEIPAKIHLFYEYAFEALFARHDSTKSGGFQRKRHVLLALDDYRRLFSYFCTISYLREMFRFDSSTILEVLSKSISASQIEVDKQSMLDDLVNCTCMISKDGLEYVFSHRSFQEYFTAYFVARVKSEEIGDVTPKLVARDRNDNVILMMSELNREQFEEAWVLPELQRIWGAIKDIDPENRLVDYLCALRGTREIRFLIEEEPDDSVVRSLIRWNLFPTRSDLREKSLFDAKYIIQKIYNIFLDIKSKQALESDVKLMNEIRNGTLMPTDKRFESIRATHESNSKRYFMLEIRAKRADSIWLRRSYYAKLSALERLALKELLDEVDARVSARNDGLADILGLR